MFSKQQSEKNQQHLRKPPKELNYKWERHWNQLKDQNPSNRIDVSAATGASSTSIAAPDEVEVKVTWSEAAEGEVLGFDGAET